LLLAVSALISIAVLHWQRRPTSRHSGFGAINQVEITHDGLAKSNVLSNGSNLYVTESVGGRHVISQIAVRGGARSTFVTSFPNIQALDISPDRLALLATPVQSGRAENEFWKVPLDGGTAQRIPGVVGRDAALAPDGKHLVFLKGSALYVSQSDGAQAHEVAALAGSPFAPRFSPDGQRIRFSMGDISQNSTSLWEVKSDGSNRHVLLPNWNNPPAECCGSWTVDGHYYIFQVNQSNPTNITTLWALPETRGEGGKPAAPIQLTTGPVSFGNAWPDPSNSKTLWALGVKAVGEVVKYDARSLHFIPLLSGISATDLDFSGDGQSVAYVTVPDGSLWRSRIDGSDRKQLTFSPERAALPRWSPDGKKIAYVAVQTGRPYNIFLVSSEGGEPQQLLGESRSQIDANWSPDGSQVMFGYVHAAEGISIKILDLKSNRLSNVPGSDGLFSPRWSPDGRYIAALSPDFTKLMLFDFRSQRWSEWLTEPAGAFSYPVWSSDSKFLYFDDLVTDEESIRRVKVGQSHPQRVFVLNGIDRYPGPFGLWSGRMPDGSWVFVRDRSTQEVYRLDLELP